MICKKHPTYKGIRPTKLWCCKPVYYWRAVRKFFGLPVAEAKPRMPKPPFTPVEDTLVVRPAPTED